MATFEAKVYKLTIEPHPNADKLELAAVGDYRAVVGKGLYQIGDLGVYVQEGSIVPKWLCEKYNWKLAGPDANRVKAIKLRGILSQGIVVPVPSEAISIGMKGVDVTDQLPPLVLAHIVLENGEFEPVEEGDDLAVVLGITKYEPPIPVHMSGEVQNLFGYTLGYDIENIKKFPDILVEGEEVIMTEKLHGTWTCLGYHPDHGPIVTSKGLSGQGLAFKMNDANKDNLYIRSLNSTIIAAEIEDGYGGIETYSENILDRGIKLFGNIPFYILGETYGAGVQDLSYGLKKPQFRIFDIYLGQPGAGRYLGYQELREACNLLLNIPGGMVLVLYHGPFSKQAVSEHTNGTERVSGLSLHIREGIVIKPVIERRDSLIGRVQLKSVSEAYLLRKGDVTELQ